MKTPEQWIQSKTHLVNKNVVTDKFTQMDILAIQSEARADLIARRKKPLLKGPKWRRVNSKRNSECSMPLEDLDWSNWWPDGFYCGQIYLHVQHKHHDTKGHDWEGTVHRVYCREGKKNRVAMKNGELYWLIDN